MTVGIRELTVRRTRIVTIYKKEEVCHIKNFGKSYEMKGEKEMLATPLSG